MAQFKRELVSEALERTLRNARHLRAKDAAAVAAARALAGKIDAWDQIVDYAMEDMDGKAKGARPAVPQNDNVSLSSFLKYLDALHLLPEEQEQVKGKSPVRKANDFDNFLKSHTG